MEATQLLTSFQETGSRLPHTYGLTCSTPPGSGLRLRQAARLQFGQLLSIWSDREHVCYKSF